MENPAGFQNVIRSEEQYFLELFERVLMSVKGNSEPDPDISRAINKIVKYCSKRGLAGLCAIDNFLTPADYWGYFYWSSPLSAGVTRNKTLLAINAYKNSQSILHEQWPKSLKREEPLKMVSVGGGTGSDLVGLYSALYEAKCDFKSMEITIMDNNSKWEDYLQDIEKYLREQNFGNASQLFQSDKVDKVINTSFMHADFRNMTPDCVSVLNMAHIVWMKGLLSILRYNDEKYTITANIISSMNLGALLVVFDSPTYYRFLLLENQLERIFSTDDGPNYALENFRAPYRIAPETNQQMIIFKKIDPNKIPITST